MKVKIEETVFFSSLAQLKHIVNQLPQEFIDAAELVSGEVELVDERTFNGGTGYKYAYGVLIFEAEVDASPEA